jgi:hypothetical protein
MAPYDAYPKYPSYYVGGGVQQLNKRIEHKIFSLGVFNFLFYFFPLPFFWLDIGLVVFV